MAKGQKSESYANSSYWLFLLLKEGIYFDDLNKKILKD